jgi:hypothetical protein
MHFAVPRKMLGKAWMAIVALSAVFIGTLWLASPSSAWGSRSSLYASWSRSSFATKKQPRIQIRRILARQRHG